MTNKAAVAGKSDGGMELEGARRPPPPDQSPLTWPRQVSPPGNYDFSKDHDRGLNMFCVRAETSMRPRKIIEAKL